MPGFGNVQLAPGLTPPQGLQGMVGMPPRLTTGFSGPAQQRGLMGMAMNNPFGAPGLTPPASPGMPELQSAGSGMGASTALSLGQLGANMLLPWLQTLFQDEPSQPNLPPVR